MSLAAVVISSTLMLNLGIYKNCGVLYYIFYDMIVFFINHFYRL